MQAEEEVKRCLELVKKVHASLYQDGAAADSTDETTVTSDENLPPNPA